MKSVCLFVISVVALSMAIDSAQARIACNHDPVCQAKRDGTSVAAARNTDVSLTSCLAAAGYTQEDWHAYRVPSGPAAKVRACLSRHGVR
jgi:hypothetical protein